MMNARSSLLIPAQAGIQYFGVSLRWIPAFAGMSG